MDRRVLVLSFGLAGVSGVAGVAAGQHEGHQAGTAAAPSTAQVTQCRQVQPVITELLNAALKRLEEARLTNSAAAMRDATDDVQAALVDMRTQLAPCGEMQLASIDAQAAPTMPNAQTSPSGAPGMPAPRTDAPAPGAADPHAGHVTPAAPQTPAARAPAAAPTRTPAAQQRSATPAAADSHAGHVMPAAPAPRTPSASAARPSASPPTSIADLKCTNAVDQRTAPRMLYQGRMYYFCTEASRAEFAKDPAKFVTAPPQAAPAHAH